MIRYPLHFAESINFILFIPKTFDESDCGQKCLNDHVVIFWTRFSRIVQLRLSFFGIGTIQPIN